METKKTKKILRFEATLSQAKKLKELGFYNGNENVFIEYADGEIQQETDYYTKNNVKGFDNSNKNYTVYEKAEHWLICEWLRAEYGIWIDVRIDLMKRWFFELQNVKDGDNHISIHTQTVLRFETPQEATSVAIDYVLDLLKTK